MDTADAPERPTTWGKLIAARRRDLGYTQRSLADALEITVTAVSLWERDEITPSTVNQRALVKLLAIDAEMLHRLYTGDAA